MKSTELACGVMSMTMTMTVGRKNGVKSVVEGSHVLRLETRTLRVRIACIAFTSADDKEKNWRKMEMSREICDAGC